MQERRGTAVPMGRAADDVNISEPERLASMLAGGALAIFGLMRRSPVGLALAASGGYLVYRGARGHCDLYAALGIDTSSAGHGMASGLLGGPISVERTVTISRPRAEVYRFWRRLENLPRFMQHLESVQAQDERRSHWVARAPLGATVAWDAEITDEREDEYLAWRSLEGSQIATSGRVEFADAPGGRGTEVKVRLQYSPPAGQLGATIARLLGEEPSQQVADDLRHLKQLLETGEIASTAGQPSGRATAGPRAGARRPSPAPPRADQPSAAHTPPAAASQSPEATDAQL